MNEEDAIKAVLKSLPGPKDKGKHLTAFFASAGRRGVEQGVAWRTLMDLRDQELVTFKEEPFHGGTRPHYRRVEKGTK